MSTHSLVDAFPPKWPQFANHEGSKRSSLWLRSITIFPRRPRFCGAKLRWGIFSRSLMNSPVPNGRPVCVHWRMAASLDSISPAARYSCQVVTVQWLYQTCVAKQLSAALVPQCAAALDQDQDPASGTSPPVPDPFLGGTRGRVTGFYLRSRLVPVGSRSATGAGNIQRFAVT
jgi:hypothetical protein